MIFIEKTQIRKEKYEFSYLDYLYFCDKENWERIVNGMYPIFKKAPSISVADYSMDYFSDSDELQTKNVKKTRDKIHDKIFKDLLQDKNEAVHFINKFCEYKTTIDDLELYNPNYITDKFKYKNADIVYKTKNSELYFLIEHQTKVDYSMAYRIFNYCLEIIRNAVENQDLNRLSFKYPRIVPIVLYTGNQKWSSSCSFAELQEGESKCNFDKIDVKYKLVNVNDFESQELLNQNTMLANAMLLEKSNNNDDVLTFLSMIRKNIKNNTQLRELKRIVSYLYKNEDESTLNQIIKILEESECEDNMSTVADRISRELAADRKAARIEGITIGINQGISQGIVQSIRQIIEKMIKMKFEDVTIKQVTGAKKSEIEKIRKELNM